MYLAQENDVEAPHLNLLGIKLRTLVSELGIFLFTFIFTSLFRCSLWASILTLKLCIFKILWAWILTLIRRMCLME
jgi:hypothetical protein